MRKIAFLLLCFTVFCNAQDCDCETNYNWVKKTIEENDAGFEQTLTVRGNDEYQYFTAKLFERVKTAKTKVECQNILWDYLHFFRKGHISISQINNKNQIINSKIEIPNNWEKISIQLDEFKKQLERKQKPDYEGIWAFDGYEVAVKKFDNQYKAILLKSPNEEWKKEEVKFVINDTEIPSCDYFMRDKSKQVYKNVHLISDNYLQLNNTMLKRIFPVTKNENETDFEIECLMLQEPFYKKIAKNTSYIRIPSFSDDYKKSIDSIIRVNSKNLNSTSKLIIDLRNNGGGSDMCYSELIPLIYTNPIRVVSVQMYSTPLNNERCVTLMNNDNFSKEDKEEFKKMYEILNQNIGKFVNLDGDEKVGIDADYKENKKIKEVSILINGGCGSTTEQFLLAAKQSKKVKLYGTTTYGSLDISNMNFVESPTKDFRLGYCLSKSFRIPDMAIDGKGIQPDIYIDESISKYNWIKFVKEN